MSDISAVTTGPIDRGDALPLSPHERAATRRGADTQHQRPSDRVELSDRARFLGKLAALPEMRSELVDHVRRQIEDGSYESSDRLDAAIEQLADDLDLLA